MAISGFGIHFGNRIKKNKVSIFMEKPEKPPHSSANHSAHLMKQFKNNQHDYFFKNHSSNDNNKVKIVSSFSKKSHKTAPDITDKDWTEISIEPVPRATSGEILNINSNKYFPPLSKKEIKTPDIGSWAMGSPDHTDFLIKAGDSTLKSTENGNYLTQNGKSLNETTVPIIPSVENGGREKNGFSLWKWIGK